VGRKRRAQGAGRRVQGAKPRRGDSMVVSGITKKSCRAGKQGYVVRVMGCGEEAQGAGRRAQGAGRRAQGAEAQSR
jgi:hypothetical protein